MLTETGKYEELLEGREGKICCEFKFGNKFTMTQKIQIEDVIHWSSENNRYETKYSKDKQFLAFI